MVSTLVIIGAVLAGLVAGWAAKDLHQRFEDIETRLASLEKAKLNHLPYDKIEKIENATGAILALRRETDLYQSLIDNALAHMGQAREDKRN